MGARGPVGKASTAAPAGARLVAVVPEPPDDLGPDGKAEWRRVGDELGPAGRNVLTEAALGLLEDLARVLDDAVAFRAEWKRAGLTVVGKGREFGHPMIAAEREARRAANQLRRELGITPSSSARVPSGPSTKKSESGFEDVE